MTEFVAAVGFLTVLPVGKARSPSPEALARSVKYFPVVGLVVGFLLAAVDAGASLVFPAPFACAIVVLANAVLTGGMHLDGLADTVDGLCGGVTREEALALMKSGTIGSFGALALFLDMLLRFALLFSLPLHLRLRAVILVPVIGRWCIAHAVTGYPYARSESGLGQAFVLEGEAGRFGRATVLAGGICLLVGGIQGLGAQALGILAAVGAGGPVVRRLGGMTGDVYGYVNEVAEILALAGLAATGAVAGVIF